MRVIGAMALVLAAVATGADKLPLPGLDPALRKDLESYLVEHYQTPEEYVVAKFKDHDIVFLGESHWIKSNVELVQRLIPRLHKAGIQTLCTEFARREDQSLIDRLLAGREYDEALAREITLRSSPTWGFQEYVDIYRAAWRVNHSLPEGARPFRILALGDSPDWSVLKRPEDLENPELRGKAWGPDSGEDRSANVVLDQVVAKGWKALVYCGSHHAFTEYRQPVFDEKTQRLLRLADDRIGNYVFHAIGKRAITIRLHGPWPPATGYRAQFIYPAGGAIDALIKVLPPRYRSAGFNTKGTPFGSLVATDSVYKWGYEPFALEKYCDGYIIQGPLSGIAAVTPIKDFINASNIDRVRRRWLMPASRALSIDELNARIARDAQSAVSSCRRLE